MILLFTLQPEDFKMELEAKEEVAKNRLIELEKLQESHRQLVEERELLKQQVIIIILA